MTIKTNVTVTGHKVFDDGRVSLTEETEYLENGERKAARRDNRMIEVGDDVSGEDQLTQDIVKDLHTPARVAARQAILNPPEPEPEDEDEPEVVTPDEPATDE